MPTKVRRPNRFAQFLRQTADSPDQILDEALMALTDDPDPDSFHADDECAEVVELLRLQERHDSPVAEMFSFHACRAA